MTDESFVYTSPRGRREGPTHFALAAPSVWRWIAPPVALPVGKAQSNGVKHGHDRVFAFPYSPLCGQLPKKLREHLCDHRGNLMLRFGWELTKYAFHHRCPHEAYRDRAG